MTRDEAVSLIKGRLARWNDTNLEQYIILEMKAAQARLEEGPPYPWFLITEDASITTAIGEDRIPLPEDFILEADDDAMYLLTADGAKYSLKKDDRESLSELEGRPTRYAITGHYFRLGPVPDEEYTVRMIYYAKDSLLETNIENKWLKYAADLLMAETAQVIAAKYLRNPEIAMEFTADANKARTRLSILNQAQLDANREYRSED